MKFAHFFAGSILEVSLSLTLYKASFFFGMLHVFRADRFLCLPLRVWTINWLFTWIKYHYFAWLCTRHFVQWW